MSLNYADFPVGQQSLAMSLRFQEMFAGRIGYSNSPIVTDQFDLYPNGSEGFRGTLRSYKAHNTIDYSDSGATDDQTLNFQTPDDSTTDIALTPFGTSVQNYAMSARAVAAAQNDVVRALNGDAAASEIIVTQALQNNLRDIDQTLFEVLNGVAAFEATRPTTGGTRGGVGNAAVTDEAKRGFFYDTFDGTNARPLIGTGTNALDRVIEAATHAWGDSLPEDEPLWLFVGDNDYIKLQQARISDERGGVAESEISSLSFLDGKFRVLRRSAAFDDQSALTAPRTSAANSGSDNTSFLIRAGALAFRAVNLWDLPIELHRAPLTGRGSGRVTGITRWGFVLHPLGWSVGLTAQRFAKPDDFDAAGDWSRVYDAKNLGILPIFHSA